MQDTKVFSEIIKDSLEDLEKEIVEHMDVLERVLQKKYKEDPFRMIHLIDSSSDEIEGMILGVFITCLQIKIRYFHTEQYTDDAKMLIDKISSLRDLKNEKCNEYREIYHWNPIQKLMNRHEEGSTPETEEG